MDGWTDVSNADSALEFWTGCPLPCLAHGVPTEFYGTKRY